MLREYLRYAGTDGAACEPVRALTGTMDKALGVFENYMTDSGLIGPTPLLALRGLGAGLAGRRAGRRARGAADRDLRCMPPLCVQARRYAGRWGVQSAPPSTSAVRLP